MMSEATVTPGASVEDSFDVSLSNPGERGHNTLVLSGIDLILPLEIDLDCDPLHDDEVRLASEDGAFARVLLSSDPDVTPDAQKRLLLYRFRAVPPGVYRVAVKIGDRWSDLVLGLVVSRRGVFLGQTKLSDDSPDAADPPDAPPIDVAAESEPDDFDEVMDVNDGHRGGAP